MLQDKDPLCLDTSLPYYIYIPRKNEEKYYQEVANALKQNPTPSQL